MGVQGFVPKSPETVVHNVAPVVQRPVLQNLQSADTSMVAVQHGGARRSVALVVGGGLSLSAFTFTWLGRRSRRQPRPLQRHAARSIASRKTGCKKAAEGQERQEQPSCLTCLERRKRPSLELHFLYASPILRPGSAERLPALSWQEEAAAVQDALGLDPEADAGSAIENDTSPSSASTYSVSTARMRVNVATVEVLSRLAAGPTSFSPPGPSWWHIAAHSEPGTGRLILEDEDGAPQVVSMAAQLFTCQTPPLGVSILACAGEQAGRALLSAGASFAVVSSGELRDTTARIFASHFYRRLQSACAMSASEPSGKLKLGESFASQVRLAFGVAREALQTATNPAVRVEARKLLLLERGLEEVPSATSRRSLADCWMPVAMSSEILPGARAAIAKTGVEDEASTSAEDDAGEMIAEDSASSLSTCSKETFPQDCEDFVGRGADLQRLLQIVGTSGGRRLVILHGPNGAGKSALGAELCRFATSPGRKFAPVKGNRRLAFVSLQDPGRGSDADTAAACARLSIFAAAAGLGSPKSFEGRLVRTCLVVDDAEERLGWRDEFVPELLDKNPQLCILLLRRSPLYRLAGDGGERWKPVNITLGPLPEMEAAQLFLQRLHRPIFPSDLSRDSEKAGEPLRPTEDLLRRMTELPALAACKGFPRKVVRLAAEVTWELPSLLHLNPGI